LSIGAGETTGGGAWTRRGEWLEVTPGKIITGAEDTQATIDKWLLETVGMPEKLHLRLRREGGIQWKGDRLRLALFPDREAGIEPIWEELEVLYEDDFCLVAHKPAGMAVHPDGSGTGVTLDHLVAAHYITSGESVAVRHIHRLDKDTTGPVMYVKNEFAQLVLDENMREKSISRHYAAIVEGTVPPVLKVIDAPIGRDRHHAARRRVSPGGQSAVTRIIEREALHGGSLVHVQLETGRTHQIRVHLSHMGHPLYGDELYGGPIWASSAAGRHALHGESLSFRHPWSGEQLEVSDPWPEDMLQLRELLSEAP
jgi:23S rRNA pseudouridine1911/1915/1917 synthase